MRHARRILLMAALVWGVASVPVPATLAAQDAAQTTSAESWPVPDPEDVTSMDAIISALYDVISGPAGEKRDWDRFRSLFVPEARLIPTGVGQTGNVGYRPMTPDGYVANSGR